MGVFAKHEAGVVRIMTPNALTVSDAERLLEDLEDAIYQTRLEQESRGVVQVEYVGSSSSRTYAYKAPVESLTLGDIVEVPSAFGTQIAKVVGFGRNGYKGPLKDVTAKLFRGVLA